jgi:hypothetical protein
VASSLIWIAVFDILLCALDEIQSDPIWTMNKDGNLKPSKSIAYADDLFTLQASTAALQKQADVVSAFCLVTGLSLSTDKFRAFFVVWGVELVWC